MANRFEQHNIHNQKSIFLPMFCRLSIKDVKQTCHTRAAAGEPSSPKVSCMGQVKRNNRVTGYPTAAAAANHHKHTLTKRNKTLIFSGKALFPNTAAVNSGAIAGAGGGARSCRTGREVTRARVRKSRGSRVAIDVDQDCVEVDIAEMDPPLPVVKRAAPPGGGRDEVNIWKRRFNGVGGLKSLEIEKMMNLPECKFQSPPRRHYNKQFKI